MSHTIHDQDKVRILFCGDFMSRNPENIRISSEFGNVIKICDLKCINFEGSIALGAPKSIKGTAALQQSIDSPAWCEGNGFNIISLANNHMLDYGQDALITTIKSFKSALTLGAGDWDQAYQVKRADVKGLKIGFMSLAQCEFGILNDNWNNNHLCGCAWINHSKINSIIREEKKKLDYLFVITHAGIEYYDIPLPEWRDRYKELIDLGADAILGGHPHVPQGWEIYNGRPIFYSLGIFFFDLKSIRENWNSGLSVILEIDKSGSLTFQLVNTIKVGNELLIDTSETAQRRNKKLCQKLVDQYLYIDEVNKLCLELWPSFENVLLRSLNGEKTDLKLKNFVKQLLNILKVRKPEYRLLINHIRCESSRYVIVRALKQIAGVEI